MKLTDTIFTLVEPTVNQLGYELYEVEFVREFDNWVLTLYIDSPHGVTLDDCEIVNNVVEPLLDEADPIEQQYYLSISSLGIDRPLKIDKDFQRNIGKVLDVKLYAALNGKKEFMGKLVSFDLDNFTIEEKNGLLVTFDRKKTASVKPHIDFNSLV